MFLLNDPPERLRVPFLLAGLFCLLCGGAHLAYYGSPVFPMDDAYISLHNAQALLDGTDNNFDVPFLVGATSSIHVFLLALFGLVMPIKWAGWVVCLVAGGFFAAGVLHLCRLRRLPSWAGAMVLVLSFISGMAMHQFMNGLETGLAMTALLWTLVRFESGPRQKGGWYVLLGTLPFFRPELAIFTGLMVLLCGWRISRAGDDVRRGLLRLGIFLTAGAAPFLAANFFITGSVIPATMGAKTAFFAELGLPVQVKIQLFKTALTNFLWPLGPLALALLVPLRTRSRLGLVFMLVFLGAYFLRFPGALIHYEGRYLYLFFPLMIVALVDGLAREDKKWKSAFLVLLVVSFGYGLWQFPKTVIYHRNTRNFTIGELKRVADWCNENLEPGSRLLIHDAGYISYGTDFPLSDMVGLKTPAAIPLNKHYSQPTRGDRRGLGLFRLAEQVQPDYLIVFEHWDGIFRITQALQRGGWALVPIYREQYKVYKIIQDWQRQPGAGS